MSCAAPIQMTATLRRLVPGIRGYLSGSGDSVVQLDARVRLGAPGQAAGWRVPAASTGIAVRTGLRRAGPPALRPGEGLRRPKGSAPNPGALEASGPLSRAGGDQTELPTAREKPPWRSAARPDRAEPARQEASGPPPG
jgi:hypothetical protein